MRDSAEAQLLVDLQSARESIALNLAMARQLEQRTNLLRLARKDASAVELQLAETIAEIRIDLKEVVARLERDSGEEWTAGLRASQFARELHGAKAHLGAATVIWGRLGFVIEKLSERVPNDGKEPPQKAIAA